MNFHIHIWGPDDGPYNGALAMDISPNELEEIGEFDLVSDVLTAAMQMMKQQTFPMHGFQGKIEQLKM